MTITPNLLEAFLKCPTKCWLRSQGAASTGNAYAEWVRAKNESYRNEGIKRLLADILPDAFVFCPSDTANWRTGKWRFAVNFIARAQNLESSIHVVERRQSDGIGQASSFVPLRLVFTDKLTRHDRLAVAFDAAVLSETTGISIDFGEIIHGDNFVRLRVKTSALASDVRQQTSQIAELISRQTPPEILLNRHCAECEFQHRCRQEATAADDLSLLSEMSAKERCRYRSKGIFTVTQFSYTFRPRKAPKRAKNPAKPRHLALQALAIRENTTYFDGTPSLPQCSSQVYVDIEGLPDRDFFYLIGALVVVEGQETFHSFWADKEDDQAAMFARFGETILKLPDFRVFHFGRYDATAIKRVAATFQDDSRQGLETVLQGSVNVLSLIRDHVYFPTYSNSLKEIGRLLGFQWRDSEASGLKSIICRESWETSKSAETKADLLRYNQDDCFALKLICDFLSRGQPGQDPNQYGLNVNQTVEGNAPPHWRHFEPKSFSLPDFGYINKCAYFDYQREKVNVRTHREFAAINRGHRRHRKTILRANTISPIPPSGCPKCGKRRIVIERKRSWKHLDLKFSPTGVKKWVTEFRAWRCLCPRCGERFSSTTAPGNPQKHGHGLVSWCVYWNIVRGVNMGRVQKSLGDLFQIFIPYCRIHGFKPRLVTAYQNLYTELLGSILAGPLIHIDETTVNLVGTTGYVWVLASMDRVHYFYRPSREGKFLSELLKPFSGVLVSDFFRAYDTLGCVQQKCLVHLIRELDDDLLRNPLDAELRKLAQEFGTLLRKVIETVDRYGLKKRHLHKHTKEVRRFLDSVESRATSSVIAAKYTNRFQKSGVKMFTFLEYDGIPWNNNNAEHAIKRFAKYRRDTNGRFTEKSLKEYLVMASVLETCEFNNVNVLKFLLSGENTLKGLFKMAGRKPEKSLTSTCGITGGSLFLARSFAHT